MTAQLILDDEFEEYVLMALAESTASVELCTFLLDFGSPDRTSEDVQRIAAILRDISCDGVFVRVLLASPRSAVGTRSNMAAAMYLNELGVQCRLAVDPLSLHRKLLIVDRAAVILGGHNMTSTSFSQNSDISVQLRGHQDIVNEACAEFDSTWERATRASLLDGLRQAL